MARPGSAYRRKVEGMDTSPPLSPDDIECRWCAITPALAQDGHPLCGATDEEHEFGWWTRAETADVKHYARCPSCDNGMVWNPTVDGNVEDCYRCGGTGYVEATIQPSDQVEPY